VRLGARSLRQRLAQRVEALAIAGPVAAARVDYHLVKLLFEIGHWRHARRSRGALP